MQESEADLKAAQSQATPEAQWEFLFAEAQLLENTGKFEEAAFDFGIAAPEDGKPVSGMGVAADDFDNDGRTDIAYTALRDETFPLYRNTGKQFVEVTSGSRMSALTRSMSGWGIAFADLDNDGWKDLAAACSDASL